jgi:hypothetical protein
VHVHATLTAGLLAAVSLTACGSSSKPKVVILNTEKIERAIEQTSMTQRKKRVHVSCPSGVHQKKGLVFSCLTIGGRGTTRFVVTETDGKGHVHFVAP